MSLLLYKLLLIIQIIILILINSCLTFDNLNNNQNDNLNQNDNKKLIVVTNKAITLSLYLILCDIKGLHKRIKTPNNGINNNENNIIDLKFIESQMNTFVIAGHDTTTSSLTWLIYLLGHHDTTQNKLIKEIDNYLLEENNNNDNNESISSSILLLKLKKLSRFNS